MASDKGVAAVLAYLHELYPTRELNATTLDAWALVFADWPDAELQAAAMQAAGTPGRTFFPAPGEIAAFRRTAQIVDGAKLLRQISALSVYNAHSGMIAPQVWQVREKLGDVLADAYATAGGGARCFSDDETTRAIAYREFQKAATEYAAMPAGERPLLESGAGPRKIAPRNAKPEAISGIVTRALNA